MHGPHLWLGAAPLYIKTAKLYARYSHCRDPVETLQVHSLLPYSTLQVGRTSRVSCTELLTFLERDGAFTQEAAGSFPQTGVKMKWDKCQGPAHSWAQVDAT